MPVAEIDTHALLELLWAAPLAVAAVVVSWGMVVHGTTRAVDARRDGRIAIASVHATLAGLGALLFVATVAAGLIVMAAK